MRVCAVIVAGGRSSRMGREKMFETIRGRSILDRIVSGLQEQVEQVVLNANGDVDRFQDAGLRVIGDLRRDVPTPLAGLHAIEHHPVAAHRRGYCTYTIKDAKSCENNKKKKEQGA